MPKKSVETEIHVNWNGNNYRECHRRCSQKSCDWCTLYDTELLAGYLRCAECIQKFGPNRLKYEYVLTDLLENFNNSITDMFFDLSDEDNIMQEYVADVKRILDGVMLNLNCQKEKK